jgi:hypothetical protein
MHGAAGGAPRGNKNASKHGEFSAETLAFKRQLQAVICLILSRQSGRSKRSERAHEAGRRADQRRQRFQIVEHFGHWRRFPRRAGLSW